MTVSARLGEANAALNFNTYNLRRALCRTAFELRALAVAALIGATTQRNAGIVVLRATTEIPKVLIGYQERRARSSPMGGSKPHRAALSGASISVGAPSVSGENKPIRTP